MKKTYIIGSDSTENQTKITNWFEGHLRSFTDINIKRYNFDNYDADPFSIKPTLIKESLKEFDCIVWLDNDIEILESIDCIFDLLEYNKIAMCRDPFYHQMNNSFNGGIVGVCKGLDILEKWEDSCAKSVETSSQTIISKLLLENKNNLIELPEEFMCLRLNLKNLDKRKYKTIHWTGPEGKNHIMRNLINEST